MSTISRPSPSRRVARTLAFAAAGVFTLLAALTVAAPAFAHNYYVSSTPGVDEVLTTLPDQFTVTTNDNLLDLEGSVGGFLMKVTGPDGLYYGDGCVTVNGPSVSMPAALGPAGDYTLDWQVVSADGHTVSGTIPFQWQPSDGGDSASAGSSTVPNCGSDTTVAPDVSAGSAGDDVTTDILWIGGAIGVVAVVVIATLLLIRPKKKDESQQ